MKFSFLVNCFNHICFRLFPCCRDLNSHSIWLWSISAFSLVFLINRHGWYFWQLTLKVIWRKQRDSRATLHIYSPCPHKDVYSPCKWRISIIIKPFYSILLIWDQLTALHFIKQAPCMQIHVLLAYLKDFFCSILCNRKSQFAIRPLLIGAMLVFMLLLLLVSCWQLHKMTATSYSWCLSRRRRSLTILFQGDLLHFTLAFLPCFKDGRLVFT